MSHKCCWFMQNRLKLRLSPACKMQATDSTITRVCDKSGHVFNASSSAKLEVCDEGLAL
jgi:hypothetical protein